MMELELHRLVRTWAATQAAKSATMKAYNDEIKALEERMRALATTDESQLSLFGPEVVLTWEWATAPRADGWELVEQQLPWVVDDDYGGDGVTPHGHPYIAGFRRFRMVEA